MIKKSFYLPIAGTVILVIAGFAIMSIDFNQSEIITEKDTLQSFTDTTTTPIVTTVSHEISKAQVNLIKVIPVESESIKVTPTIKNSESSDLQEFLIQSAFAIPSGQLAVTIDEWTVPTAGSSPLFVAVDGSDNVYFTERLVNKIARLDPLTNVITEWGVPTASFRIEGVAVDGSDNVYFTEGSVNKIARLDPLTNVITEWTVPTANADTLGVAVDSFDNVYFTESDGNKIGKMS